MNNDFTPIVLNETNKCYCTLFPAGHHHANGQVFQGKIEFIDDEIAELQLLTQLPTAANNTDPDFVRASLCEDQREDNIEVEENTDFVNEQIAALVADTKPQQPTDATGDDLTAFFSGLIGELTNGECYTWPEDPQPAPADYLAPRMFVPTSPTLTSLTSPLLSKSLALPSHSLVVLCFNCKHQLAVSMVLPPLLPI